MPIQISLSITSQLVLWLKRSKWYLSVLVFLFGFVEPAGVLFGRASSSVIGRKRNCGVRSWNWTPILSLIQSMEMKMNVTILKYRAYKQKNQYIVLLYVIHTSPCKTIRGLVEVGIIFCENLSISCNVNEIKSILYIYVYFVN